MDKGSIGGVILAIAGIIAGLLIEGGKISQILQPTAALIVLWWNHRGNASPVPNQHRHLCLPQHGTRICCAAEAE